MVWGTTVIAVVSHDEACQRNCRGLSRDVANATPQLVTQRDKYDG
jgi:hypothetical protein